MRRKQKALKIEIRKLKVFGVTTLFTFISSYLTILAQKSFSVTDCNTSGSGSLPTYYVGQLVYTTNIETSSPLSEGIQQPYKISIVTELEEAKEINLLVSAYPNQTTDYLILYIPDFNLFPFTFPLFYVNGKLLQSEKITGNQTNIVMSNLLPAKYFISVTLGSQFIKEFKIIKN